MRIDTAYVGTRLHPYETTVTARQTTNYAAAVGETDACYYDDTASGGVIAHPVFPVAVTWPVTLNLAQYMPDKTFPLELMAMQVHHTEHIAIFSPMRPGQRLTVNGTVAAIEPHRAGTRVVIRYDAGTEDGSPVFTEHIGGLLRGIACSDAGRHLPGLPQPPPPDPEAPPLWETPVAIGPTLPYIYDGCSDIVFPIHTSPAFARDVGLPGILLQGTATLALAVRTVLAKTSDVRPASVCEVACRFTGMVFPGSSITVRLRSRSSERDAVVLGFDVLDDAGRPVVRKGRIACRPHPHRQENAA